jgi:hypothetical protein
MICMSFFSFHRTVSNENSFVLSCISHGSYTEQNAIQSFCNTASLISWNQWFPICGGASRYLLTSNHPAQRALCIPEARTLFMWKECVCVTTTNLNAQRTTFWMFEALRCKAERRRFETWWGKWCLWVWLILPPALCPGVYSSSNRNESQK